MFSTTAATARRWQRVTKPTADQCRLSGRSWKWDAKMQQDLTDKLAEDGQPDFTLVWGTGRATYSSVPANVRQMSLRPLATFVLVRPQSPKRQHGDEQGAP